MAVEEWVVLARDGLLKLDQDEYLVDDKDTESELNCQQREIDVVAVVEDVLQRNATVEIAFEAEVEDGQRDLNGHVEGKNNHDARFRHVVCLLSTLDTLAVELVDTATFAEAVVDFANLVKQSAPYLLS